MKRVKIVVFMVAIAALYGAGVTGLHLSTIKTVEQNNRLIEQKALVELFGLGDVKMLSKEKIGQIVATQIDQTETLTDPQTGKTIPLLKAYDSAARDHLTAYGFPFSGIGFWAEIKGYIAVDASLQKTVGLKVIEQVETPGLGARIEEPFFVKPFANGLDISTPAPGKSYIYMGTAGSTPDPGTPQYGRTFDAITGATQTSLAMERMLNAAVAEFRRAADNREAGVQ
ncbi:MAG: FMN-binding protein [Kiritimatiellales bacterium]|nr:FMN-binding protein [Kiritimatiellota bacterium]MBL7012037.1 FMN-binding protein [Kiritimatiellales bacterium]